MFISSVCKYGRLNRRSGVITDYLFNLGGEMCGAVLICKALSIAMSYEKRSIKFDYDA